MTNLAINQLKRAAIGFVAGLVVAWFVLLFFGQLRGHNDLSQRELDQEIGAIWLALYIACGIAVVAVAAGRLRLPRFWLWFCLAFGVLCVIPFWPHKDGGLLPLATPYVNADFQSADAVSLTIHIAVALVIAASMNRVWKSVADTQSTTGQPRVSS